MRAEHPEQPLVVLIEPILRVPPHQRRAYSSLTRTPTHSLSRRPLILALLIDELDEADDLAVVVEDGREE